MSFLVDTSVISELRKGPRCNPGVSSWFAGLATEDIFLSVVTVGEIRKGIENIRRRDPRSAASLETWFQGLVDAYADRILNIERTVAEEWGRLNVPNPLPALDGLLAATASVHGLTVATRNVRDILRSGVDCFNPFSDEP